MKSYVLFIAETKFLLNFIHDKIQFAHQPHIIVQVNLKPKVCTGLILFVYLFLHKNYVHALNMNMQ